MSKEDPTEVFQKADPKKRAHLGGTKGFFDPNETTPRGVYAAYPASTPRYSRTDGQDRVLNNASGNGQNTLDNVARIYLTGISPGTGMAASDLGYPSHIEKGRTLFEKGYIGFILNQVTEAHEEKSQILSLNGDSVAAYFLGQSPVIYRFSGYLLNTVQDPWRTQFSELYQYVFRGSKVAASRRMVQIAYDDKIVTGSMLGLSQSLDSTTQMASQFNFNLLVKHILQTSTPSKNVDASAYRGNTEEFEKVTVVNPQTLLNLSNTSSVVPPPRPKRRTTSKKVAKACPDPAKERSNTSRARVAPRANARVANKCKTTKDKAHYKKQLSGINKKLANKSLTPKARKALLAKQKIARENAAAAEQNAHDASKKPPTPPADTNSDKANTAKADAKTTQGAKQIVKQLLPAAVTPRTIPGFY